MENLQKILRLPEVINITGLKRSTIYKKVKEKTFPAPVKLTERSVGWLESEVREWLNSCILRRRE